METKLNAEQTMRITAGCLALFLWATLANGSLSRAQIKAASVPMKSYADDVGGVSLRYPSVWTFSQSGESYFPSVIAPSGEPLQAVFSFSPQGNYYEHTVLTGLEFLYRRLPAADAPACESILSTNSGNAAKVEHLTVNGVAFAHLSTGEAGMMKSVSQEGYATWRGGTCYLFEADLSQIGKGADDDKNRNLTASEVRALLRHLTDILKSVRFSAPNAGKSDPSLSVK